MLNLLSSTASATSKAFRPNRRPRTEGNCAWLERQLKGLRSFDAGRTELTHVVLVGGIGDVPFRLRVAQSHLRHDLKPSHWSHAVLIESLRPVVSSIPILEISLE